MTLLDMAGGTELENELVGVEADQQTQRSGRLSPAVLLISWPSKNNSFPPFSPSFPCFLQMKSERKTKIISAQQSLSFGEPSSICIAR